MAKRTITITMPDAFELSYQSGAKAVKRFAVVSNLTHWTDGEYHDDRRVGPWGLCSEHATMAAAEKSYRTFNTSYGFAAEHLAIVAIADPAA